ncbi:Hypothetical predicted protein, partial [Pelobates cultripes]
MKAVILRDSIKHPGHNDVIDGGQSGSSRTQQPGEAALSIEESQSWKLPVLEEFQSIC